MDKTPREKAVEWSLSSIVGNFVWIAVSTLLAGLIGSLTGSFQAVSDFASANAPAAAVWSLSFLAVGTVIGALTGARIAIKRARRKSDEAIAAKDAEIAELKAAKELDALVAAFRAMPFRAKMLCAGIWQNGGIERQEVENMPGEAERSAAREAGFVVEEETSGFGRVRFSASDDLARLFTERPELYEQVLSDFARGTYQVRNGKLVRVK